MPRKKPTKHAKTAREIIDEIAIDTGWDDHTIKVLLADFIDAKNLTSELAKDLRATAQDEDDAGVDGELDPS